MDGRLAQKFDHQLHTLQKYGVGSHANTKGPSLVVNGAVSMREFDTDGRSGNATTRATENKCHCSASRITIVGLTT